MPRTRARGAMDLRSFGDVIGVGGDRLIAEVSLEFHRDKKDRQKYSIAASVLVAAPYGKKKLVKDRIEDGPRPQHTFANGTNWLGINVCSWQSGEDLNVASAAIVDTTGDLIRRVERWVGTL